jgi:hypothetical protein
MGNVRFGSFTTEMVKADVCTCLLCAERDRFASMPEKAAHHAHTARAHVIHARHHAEEAAKAHGEEHGKK